MTRRAGGRQLGKPQPRRSRIARGLCPSPAARALTRERCARRTVRSGGPPTEQGSGGTCTNTRAGTPGIGGGEGLWLFSREPTPSQAVVEQLRQVAAAKGFDLSVLVPVQQQGCSYAPFPESSGAGTPSGPFGGFSG